VSAIIVMKGATHSQEVEIKPVQMLDHMIRLGWWSEPQGTGLTGRFLEIAPGDVPDLIKSLADVLLEIAAETA
jgi:hypothetical protein